MWKHYLQSLSFISASRGQPVTGNFGCPYMANGAYAYPPPPPANGIYSGPAPPGYVFPGPPPPGNDTSCLFMWIHCLNSALKLSAVHLCPVGGSWFDGPAAYMPPPPYTAPVDQAPLDPDLPRTPAGMSENSTSYRRAVLRCHYCFTDFLLIDS